MQFKEFFTEEKNITPKERYHNMVILYGMPASGKSSVLKYGLINLPNIKVLTSDQWLELTAEKEGLDLKDPDVSNELHQRISPKFDKYRDQVLHSKNRVNLVIENIGSNYHKLLNLIRKAQAEDFRVILVWVKVEKETSVEANLKRDRRVKIDRVEVSYENTIKHFDALVDDVEEAWIIDNNTHPDFNDFRSSKFIKRIK